MSGISSASDRVSLALQGIADKLNAMLGFAAGKPVSWSLFVWTEGRASYVARAERSEIIPVLEHMISRWKAKMPDIPAHHAEDVLETRRKALEIAALWFEDYAEGHREKGATDKMLRNLERAHACRQAAQ